MDQRADLIIYSAKKGTSFVNPVYMVFSAGMCKSEVASFVVSRRIGCRFYAWINDVHLGPLFVSPTISSPVGLSR